MKYSLAILSDDMVFFNLLAILIAREQYDLSIYKCSSYSEIKNQIETNQTHLILLDGSLSFTSSFEIIEYLRNNKHILCPIWYFPEIVTEAHIHKSQELGVSKICKKPFDPFLITDEVCGFFFNNFKSNAR